MVESKSKYSEYLEGSCTVRRGRTGGCDKKLESEMRLNLVYSNMVDYISVWLKGAIGWVWVLVWHNGAIGCDC